MYDEAIEQERLAKNRAQRAVIEEIRHAGYAVIIWTPEELGDANSRKVEDRSIELGHQVIEDLQ